MKPALSHHALVQLFNGDFVYSLQDKTLFNLGVDKYILPNTIKDIQTRVLHTKEAGIALSDLKAAFTAMLKTDFWGYVNGETDFAAFHSAACDNILALLEQRYERVTYGKAQKAVNMIFKYLYCFDGAEQAEERFAHCHMPLDSKILDWYRANVDVNQATPWSKLDKAEYAVIQDKIAGHIATKYAPYTVLQAEFVIWDTEINKK